MCELFAMSAYEPATVSFSLGVLAEHGGRSAPHADGWGIAFYDDNDVRILRDTTCASRSPWVKFVEQQELRSQLVLSHIRKATDGVVAIKNTQPFSRELSGRMHVFAHNGHVPNIRLSGKLAVDAFRPIGDTDSELAFCALLERIKPLWQRKGDPPDPTQRLDVVTGFANDLAEIGLANFLYCDGEVLFVHGHRRKQADGMFKAPGLWLLRRQCDGQELSGDTVGVSVSASNQVVTLVASVPLSDEAWQPLHEQEMLAIAGGKLIPNDRTLNGN